MDWGETLGIAVLVLMIQPGDFWAMTWREFNAVIAHKLKDHAAQANRLTPQEKDELFQIGQAAVEREKNGGV